MLYWASRARVEIVTSVTESSNYRQLYSGTRDDGYDCAHVQLFQVIKLIPKMLILTAIRAFSILDY
jgi:hypothetical protein